LRLKIAKAKKRPYSGGGWKWTALTITFPPLPGIKTGIPPVNADDGIVTLNDSGAETWPGWRAQRFEC
jgi:hypothetical protein